MIEKYIDELYAEFRELRLPYAKVKRAEDLFSRIIVILRNQQNTIKKYREQHTGFKEDELYNIMRIAALIGLDERSMSILCKETQFIDFIESDNIKFSKYFKPSQLIYLSRFYNMYLFEYDKEPESLQRLKEYIHEQENN